jgi:hypothetical protein
MNNGRWSAENCSHKKLFICRSFHELPAMPAWKEHKDMCCMIEPIRFLKRGNQTALKIATGESGTVVIGENRNLFFWEWIAERGVYQDNWTPISGIENVADVAVCGSMVYAVTKNGNMKQVDTSI